MDKSPLPLNTPQARLEWVALSSVPRVGAVMMRRLLEQFGSPREVFRASKADLLVVTGLGETIAEAILEVDLAEIETRWAQWAKQQIQVITWQDNDYPARLRLLPDAPPTLFRRGEWNASETHTIAIVGTRQPSALGMQAAENLARFFAQRGWVVVSGMALGIDTHAHRGAMESAPGKTVAMLGCGLNRISPARSQHFSTQIIARGGAVFSELLPETETTSPQLVARNRLTTGMSQATIIVEAGATSGALHAAKFAQKQGRLLGAVDIVAEGNMMLIRENAYLVRHDLSNIEAFLERLTPA